MKFSEIVAQTLAWLQRDGRISYRALKLEFDLNDDVLDALKEELIEAKRLAIDENGKVLIWVGTGEKAKRGNGEKGGEGLGSSIQGLESKDQFSVPSPQFLDAPRSTQHAPRTEGERRQLTVMFCDLVGSTALSTQLDPEELREVIQAYRETCATVIRRFEGHLAKYIGDGLLVYFGYPVAHEDDAQRAVRTALSIVETLQQLSFPTIELPRPLQVRIGVHTGLVVAGEMGTADQPEPLAIVGETPNIAARLQEHAQPNSVVISPSTYRLVQGLFECQDLGSQLLKGLSTPLLVYRVVGESEAQSRFEVAVRAGLTPLVGRAHEMGLLRERWEQAKGGAGQVVLLSGEAGIGKSRLVQTLKEQVSSESATRIEFRCSTFYQNTAFYPVIEHLQRLLQLQRDDTPDAKLAKLERVLAAYRFPQTDTVPLFASLLSLPHPKSYPPLTVSPQKQKQKTQDALVSWLVEEAEQAAVYCVWEDLHWADPSSQEFLGRLMDQAALARLLLVLTFRPEFTPPWASRAHLTSLTLSRLPRTQVEEMVERVLGGKALPPEVFTQIVSKTDGVPLFVEELTKTVMESVEAHGHAPLQSLAIPATLQDSLMARLDRLGDAKAVAQLGATLGREFNYDVLQAVSPLNEGMLQQGLKQLVEAEVVYQNGVLPQARYLFKHALVQDTAYKSLLKSTRRQYHRQIAQVLAERFPETVKTQPELLAHHYSRSGNIQKAMDYLQLAGEQAVRRSANIEAISHFTAALQLLGTLPETAERTQRELTLQVALGVPLLTAKGWAAPEARHTYARARALCQQVGETPQLFSVLRGLWEFYHVGAELQTARVLAEQLLSLAHNVQDSSLLLEAHSALGMTLMSLGEETPALNHAEQLLALYDPQRHHAHAFLYGGYDPGVNCLGWTALSLWMLGYPNQALKRIFDAFTLAQELSHPNSLAITHCYAAQLHQLRREGVLSHERAETAQTFASEYGFPLAWGTILGGWARAEQGQSQEGLGQMRRDLESYEATGAKGLRSYFLALIAEAYGKTEQVEKGLAMLDEALAQVDKTGERFHEAELYRLKGELTLQQLQVSSSKFQAPSNPQPPAPNTQAEAEAEECFRKAIEIARKQQAKSWELRAVMSLARLWQQQGKQKQAHNMLSTTYNWFTEGFDTKDLQEAKALIEELSIGSHTD